MAAALQVGFTGVGAGASSPVSGFQVVQEV